MRSERERKVYELEKACLSIRKDILNLATREVMHVGGDLSITDVVTVLWQYQMKYDSKNPFWEERDRFVLSKGHASAVAAFNQAAIGCYEKKEILDTYAKDGSKFSMHTCNLINPYIEISAGSLGHGLPIACGIAAGLKLKGNKKSRVYVIMGDGEQSEGSIWEAVLNAPFHKLGNLVAIIDNNGLGGDAELSKSTSLGNIAEKYKSFGWIVEEFDGNDVSAIIQHLENLPPADSDVPIVFVCDTIKGKGVPFMERNPKWHCGSITREQYEELSQMLDKQFFEKWGVYND